MKKPLLQYFPLPTSEWVSTSIPGSLKMLFSLQLPQPPLLPQKPQPPQLRSRQQQLPPQLKNQQRLQVVLRPHKNLRQQLQL